MTEGNIRKNRVRDDLRVVQVERLAAEQFGFPAVDLVDPNGKPYHGSTKIGTVRAESDSARQKGVPRAKQLYGNSTVGSAERKVALHLGLPEGSVRVRNTDGRDTRSDKRVVNHRRDHTQ